MARLALIPSVLGLGAQLAGAAEPAPSGALLDRAAERAIAYDRAALAWTCEETVRLATYGEDGKVAHETERHFALLMGRESTGQAAVELRAADSSSNATADERPRALDRFPPTTSWLRLFHPVAAGFVRFEDRGEDRTSGVARHGFAFQGALPYTRGEDFREWEGTAWLDPATGDLLAIEAAPLSQKERLTEMVDRRARHALRVKIFEVLRFGIGPKAHGQRVEVSFGPHEDGFWLPFAARLETVDVVGPHTTRPLKVVVDSIERCRRFEVDATQRETRPKPR